MLNNLESLSHPPSKQQFLTTFRLVSRISFWVQLTLGGVSGIALLFAWFSRNVTIQTNNTAIGFGIFLGSLYFVTVLSCILGFTLQAFG